MTQTHLESPLSDRRVRYRTVSAAVAWWTREPLVPVTSSGQVPHRADDAVLTVKAELPGEPAGLGEKTAVVPVGGRRPAGPV